jgi:hypothetical protein
MKCTVCNNESLNLNAKYCSKCGNKLIYENYFCKGCGSQIFERINFCSNCGERLIYSYIDNDSKRDINTEEKIKEKTKEEEIEGENLVKESNREELADMDNNFVKENCLEIIPSQELIEVKTQKALTESNMEDKNMLLPVIVQCKELALIEVKNEITTLKEHKNPIGVLKFVKATVKILAKAIRTLFMASASVIGFIGVSILVIVATAIITKNIVNSYYGSTPDTDITYSIFKMKDDDTHTTMNK